MKIIPRQIAIDFDGTLTYHVYPYIGGEVPDAFRVLKRLKAAGHTLILQTMRCDELLDDAVKWCKQNGVEFDYLNCNPMFETGSRKIYSHALVDDHNVGCPLIFHPKEESRRPIVDWKAVEKMFENMGYL